MTIQNQVPSRYKYTANVIAKDGENSFNYTIDFRRPSSGDIDGNYALYTVKQGDTLQSISTKFYNAPEFWFIITDFNPEESLLYWPSNIVNIVGKTIKLPKKSMLDLYR